MLPALAYLAFKGAQAITKSTFKTIENQRRFKESSSSGKNDSSKERDQPLSKEEFFARYAAPRDPTWYAGNTPNSWYQNY